MSSELELQAAAASILENDYVSLAIVTAVAYDYVLTFSDEIEYIWNKPWSWVSTLFLIIRYSGLCNIIFVGFFGSTFMFTSLNDVDVYFTHLFISGAPGIAADFIFQWSFFVYFCAADFVMILRVWAMHGRSKVVLWPTVAIYVIAKALGIAAVVFYNVSEITTVDTLPVVDFSFCVQGYFRPTLAAVSAVANLILGGTLCILVIIPFIRESIQMYQVTKQWQLNRYMNLLIKEGVLYFLIVQAGNLVNIMGTFGKIPTAGPGPGWILAVIFEYVPLFSLTARFIMNMRRLYARSIQGNGTGAIDTAFGLGSLHGRSTVTQIAFADIGQEHDERGEYVEGITMEETRRDTCVA